MGREEDRPLIDIGDKLRAGTYPRLDTLRGFRVLISQCFPGEVLHVSGKADVTGGTAKGELAVLTAAAIGTVTFASLPAYGNAETETGAITVKVLKRDDIRSVAVETAGWSSGFPYRGDGLPNEAVVRVGFASGEQIVVDGPHDPKAAFHEELLAHFEKG